MKPYRCCAAFTDGLRNPLLLPDRMPQVTLGGVLQMTNRRVCVLLGMSVLLLALMPACGTKKNELILDAEADLSLTNRAVVAPAGSDDELLRHEYTAVYRTIRAGDVALDAKDLGSASNQYAQAFQRLTLLRQMHPQWNRDVVDFRLDYCRERLAATAARSTPR
jgi:hypothetical protein